MRRPRLSREFKDFFRGEFEWPKRDLELPRIEVHLVYRPGSGMYAIEFLVRHTPGGIVATALGAGYGMGRTDYWNHGELYLTWRVGQDARHDAKNLKIPAYVSSEKGDLASLDVEISVQTILKRAKK